MSTPNDHDESSEESIRSSSSSEYDSDGDSYSSVDEQQGNNHQKSTSLVLEHWRQHAVAILVAIIATVVAHNYVNKREQQLTIVEETRVQQHEHIRDYQRTAHVAFCDPTSTTRLQLMDFHIPLHLIPAMESHFLADAWQDDAYDRVVNDEHRDTQILLERFPEWDCLVKQQKEGQRPYVKGFTLYVKEPSIQSIYGKQENEDAALTTRPLPILKRHLPQQHKPKPIAAAVLTFTGFGAKFYNLSRKPVLLYWEFKDQRKLVGEIPPFQSLGTATTASGQSFCVTPVYDSSHALQRWIVTADDAVQYYDPEDQHELSLAEQRLYEMQKLNQEYAKHYLIHTGRTWLSHFPRPRPVHFMWPAEYLGQMIQTSSQHQLVVQSVTPAVFTIDNFLSRSECERIMALALREGLQASTVYTGGDNAHTRQRSTRSSSTTWLERDENTTNYIYQRAAQLLQMDEQLFSKPIHHTVDAPYHSISESLQVLRYQRGEQYTAHHDFVHPKPTHRYQPTRFATLLLYLNDNFTGGDTVFPRAVTTDRHDGVRIQPQQGRAVLFYNILPDGNVDDLSQHASEPVVEGEKFAANVFVWEPYIN